MKKIVFLLICALFTSCSGRHNDSTETLGAETIDTQSEESCLTTPTAEQIIITLADLQGTWTTNSDENALFYIEGDSLTYVEDQGNSLLLSLSGNIFSVDGDISFDCLVVKLNTDTLWYVDSITDDTTRLIKKR